MKNVLFNLLIILVLTQLSSFGEVVINELNYDPIDIEEEGGSLREFIELYNPGPDSIDLSGYSFTSGIIYTFPDGTTLETDSYLVLARVRNNAIWSNVSYPVYGPYEGKLSNGGEKIELQRPDGTIVDEFKYNDDFPWPRGADGYGPSLERVAWDIPSDDFHTWRASDNDHGTPGKRNSVDGTIPRPMIRAIDITPDYPTSGDDVIVRIGVDSDDLISSAILQWETGIAQSPRGFINSDDVWKTWKGTAEPSAPLEWTALDFDDSAWKQSKGGFGYGDTEQVNTELSDMRNNYTTFYIRKKITLDDPAELGFLSLNIFYDDGFICYINGVEVARSYAFEEYDYQSLSNGLHESSEAESFELGDAVDLLHSGDNVIAFVGFNTSRSNSTDFVIAPTIYSSAKLSGDNTAFMSLVAQSVGGATFEAIIPAQSNQTLVRYNLALELFDGSSLRLPHVNERRPYESYFVYDNDIPSKLPVMWLFQNKVTHLPSRSKSFSCTVIKPVGDDPVQVYDGSLINQARNGHKIKFLKGEEFRGDRTINLSLESPREGTTAGGQSPHVEQISYDLFRDFGVLTPRCDWYRVIENGEHSQRIAVQQPNSNFIEINERDTEGNIYKIAYNEPGGYSKKNNLDEGDEDYRELFQYVKTSNTTNLEESVRKYLNVEEVMGYEVATFLLSHWDGFKNNIFLYHNPENDKWEIIPWDVDKTFGYTDSDPMYYKMPIDFSLTLVAPGPNELTGRHLDAPVGRPFHMVPELHQEFIVRIANALNGLFSIERMGGIIDDTEQLLLEDLVLAEQYSGETNNNRRNQITESYDTMRYFMEKRHEFLRTQLPTDFIITRSLPIKDYHAGSTINGVKLSLEIFGGKTIDAVVQEQIPSGFTPSNIQISEGEVIFINNQISWTLSNASGNAELSYDLTAPDSNPPMSAVLTGSMTVDQLAYDITDSTIKYMPDNMQSLGGQWVTGTGGNWMIIDGVLNCLAEDGTDPKHAWVDLDLGTGDYTVRADVKMVDWVDGDQARAGVAVRVNPDDRNRALNMLVHNDTGSVDMLNDLRKWGNNTDYSWKVGEWYTMILTVEGSRLEGTIFGRGSNEIPTTMVWDDDEHNQLSPGFPGLTGTGLQGLTAQFDNFQVIVGNKVVFSDNFDSTTAVVDWDVY